MTLEIKVLVDRVTNINNESWFVIYAGVYMG
jgi:hypothetical protein